MKTEAEVLESIQRAEKEFREMLEREGLTFAIREELINGQRRSFGIVFVPAQAEPEQSKIVVPDSMPLSRKVRRLLQRSN